MLRSATTRPRQRKSLPKHPQHQHRIHSVDSKLRLKSPSRLSPQSQTTPLSISSSNFSTTTTTTTTTPSDSPHDAALPSTLVDLYTKKQIPLASTSHPNDTTSNTHRTQHGQKQPIRQLDSEYQPTKVEQLWSQHWINHKLFTPSLLRAKKFVILLPPPNVTGTLHLGHALTVAIQDTITRYYRMAGCSTLWVPGVDHAGIATQVVVEKDLKRQLGLSRHDLGREAFVDKVWEWKHKYGQSICDQLQSLGASLDWTRQRFTLDPVCHDAVIEAFIRLYDSSIIYRDNRIVSWCCTLRSAISTIEIDTIDVAAPILLSIPNYSKKVEFGVIHDFKYKIVPKSYADDVMSGKISQQRQLDHQIGGQTTTNQEEIGKLDQFITVSTTRIETMLGDVAVAVHPDDHRYSFLHKPQKPHKPQSQLNENNLTLDPVKNQDQGTGIDTDNNNNNNQVNQSPSYMLEHPIIPNYFIPIVFDDVLVDMAFGTGAVKITPAHDPNDYQSAVRNQLPLSLSLLDDQGNFAHPFFSKFNGQHRYDVRNHVIDELTSLGLYGGKRPNPMAIAVCSRSGDIIEPIVKPQWWIRSDEMARNAMDAADLNAIATVKTPKKEGQTDLNNDDANANEMASLKNKSKSPPLSFSPTNAHKDWVRWLENNQDWCISRQLWWGHRIPAWYIQFDNEDGEDNDNNTTTINNNHTKDERSKKKSHIEDPKRWVIAHNADEAMEKAKVIMKNRYPQRKLKSLVQDEDVLDTWFSSGLFPFAVMGWPQMGTPTTPTSTPNTATTTTTPRNKDLLRFFPGTLLETGNDIFFFWVARMVMLSQTLTGSIPFEHVFLHTLIRDKSGRKMSKSLGNVIDPLDVINGIDLESLGKKLASSNLAKEEIEKAKKQQEIDFPNGIPSCGSDSLRFGLLSYTKQTGDINLDLNTIITSKHFKNKIWQAMRFAITNINDNVDNFTPPINGFSDVDRTLELQFQSLQQEQAGRRSLSPDQTQQSQIGLDLRHGTFEQQWILQRLATTIEQVNQCMQSYQFGEITTILQTFFTDDLCARYLEVSKTIVRKSFYSNGVETPNLHYSPVRANATLNVLYYCMETFLKLLHPLSPYLTEELWFSLPHHQHRVENEVKSVKNEIVDPIQDILHQFRRQYQQSHPHLNQNDITALQQGNDLDYTIALNDHLLQSLKTKFHSQQSTSSPHHKRHSFQHHQFLDVDSFDINTYQNRINDINAMNITHSNSGAKGNEQKLLFPLSAPDQLLCHSEIQAELDQLIQRTKSGSISVQPFPKLHRPSSSSPTTTATKTHKVNMQEELNNNPDSSVDSIHLNQYYQNSNISTTMDKLMDVVEKIRVVKARLQIPNHIKPKIILEHISPDNTCGDSPSPKAASIDQLEADVINNLDDYQHIISILSFVSQPTMRKSTTSSRQLNQAQSNNEGEYVIKQFISENVLCHIIITPRSGSNGSNENNTNAAGMEVDFSAELVKSERSLDSLTTLTQQLAQTIEKTKDNPKVPEKIKTKNALDYNNAMSEMVILNENIENLRHIVPRRLYIPIKRNDLQDQIAVLEKNKEKVESVIRDNIQSGKGGNSNLKHQEVVNGINNDIAVLQQQIGNY